MNGVIELLLVVTVIGLLMARRASRYLWTAVLGAGLIYWTVFHHPTATAIVKYHLTERMRAVMNDTMDILGGRGSAC